MENFNKEQNIIIQCLSTGTHTFDRLLRMKRQLNCDSQFQSNTSLILVLNFGIRALR